MPKAKKRVGKSSSSTAGKAKGSSCQRSQIKNLHANDTRMYRKNPDLWEKICKVIDNQKGNRPSSGAVAQ